LLSPACLPTKVLKLPVTFPAPAPSPKNEFSLPVVLLPPATAPKKALKSAVVVGKSCLEAEEGIAAARRVRHAGILPKKCIIGRGCC
jgi:hypothetical protein